MDERELDATLLRGASRPWDDAALHRLAEEVASKSVVMIGEASHGTSEFYTMRASLSKILIEDHGFSFVGVEGDWPACAVMNEVVQGTGGGDHVRDALAAFDRWPRWMWANWEVAAFAEWLRAHNARREDAGSAAFYGLDVYSMYESLEAVVSYLMEKRPDAVEPAKRAFACFEPYRRGGDFPAVRLVPEGCEDEVIEMLAELRKETPAGRNARDVFDAEQNARVVLNAERYYRAAMRGGSESWNVRDRHMQETLERLMDVHGNGHGVRAKAIVWAHNTHVGDARFTDMARSGMVNIGQLAREAFGRKDVFLVGFGTHHGRVLAGSAWGAPQEAMEVPEATAGSWEDVFHEAGRARALLMSDDVRDVPAFAQAREHRAIGVVYRPESERHGNYVPTVLPERYDAFVFVDETTALNPTGGAGSSVKPPRLYPWGF